MAQGQHSAYVVIEGPGHDGTRLPLRQGITSFGRLPANDVILLGDLVSRHHSRITYFEGRATLQDLGSHNGSWVNGERASSRVLREGDEVRVGNFVLIFREGELPGPTDETTAGELAEEGDEPKPRAESPIRLIEELEAARQGAPAPTRAVHFLYRASDALARAPDGVAYAGAMLELALEHAPSDDAAWLRLHERRLRVEARRSMADTPFDVFVPAVEWAIDKRFPIHSEDLDADPRFSGGRPGRAVAAVPVMDEEGEPVGAMVLSRDGRAFTSNEMSRLGVVAQLMREGLRDLDARQRQHRERLLASLHGAEVASALGKALLGGRRTIGPVQGVVVCIDLPQLGGTQVDRDPNRLFDVLAALQAAWLHAAEARGAIAELLNGSKALFVLGFERTVPAETGLRLALELREVTQRLVQEHRELGPGRVRASVTSGSVVAGTVRSRRLGFA
ncbi:MAG: FHA domain-containing protein, partial [Myxococcota bacterium]